MLDDIKVSAEPESAAKDAVEAESLAENLQKEVVDADTETVASDTEETSPSLDKSDGAVDEPKVETKRDVESEIDSILNEDEPVHKDGVQKRIDKLTAKLRAAEEKLAALESEKGSPKSDEPKYTEEQLKRALKKAMDDGDSDLVWEIQQYQLKQVKSELKNEYLSEQNRVKEEQERAGKEWQRVVDTYDYLASPAEKEMYQGSRKELNIKDNTSLLYQVALQLYSSKDPELFKYYRQPGGQQLAVADALQLILKKRRDRLASKEDVSSMERKLAKEKRKSSLGSGESLKEEAPPMRKYASEKERLDDVLAERKKFIMDRI